MLSRVAERVYWMARYSERAENIARIINVYTNLLLDLPRNTTIGWHSLIEITGSKKLYHELYNDDSERNVMKFLLADTRNPGSLLNSLNYARDNARTIRGILPREGWQKLNELYLSVKTELPTGISRRNRYDFLASLIGGVQQLTGLLAGTMTHNYGYHFVRIGRNLERADMTSRILDTMTVETILDEGQEDITSYEYMLWMSVLKSLSAYQSYRQEVHTVVSRSTILKFILKHRDFPRAILHCLREIQNSTQKLPRHIKPIRQLNRIIRIVETTKVEGLNSKQQHKFMDHLQLDIADFHKSFSETYFAVLEIAPRKKSDIEGKKITTRKLKKKRVMPKAVLEAATP
ncbi:alpha-E domain-containing protein [Kaarinaea lacus]